MTAKLNRDKSPGAGSKASRQKELEAEILRAHDAGDTAVLERLQEEYRDGKFLIIRDSAEPITFAPSGAPRSRSAACTSTPTTRTAASTPLLAPMPKPGTKAYRDAANDYIRQHDSDRNPITVRLSDDVHDAIAKLEDPDGIYERAFWIFGEANDRDINLIHADRVQTGEYEWMRVEGHDDALEMAARRGYALVGLVHSHPTGNVLPSPADLECFRRNSAELGARFVGLIVGPRDISTSRGYDNAWLDPKVNAFVASTTGLVTQVEPKYVPEWLAA